MPIRYAIDRPRRLVMTTAWGVLTDDDILSHKKTLDADPGFVPGMSELSDVRGINRLAVTPAGVREMVKRDREGVIKPAHRLALVVASDLVYGMARMYSLLRGSGFAGASVSRPGRRPEVARAA